MSRTRMRIGDDGQVICAFLRHTRIGTTDCGWGSQTPVRIGGVIRHCYPNYLIDLVDILLTTDTLFRLWCYFHTRKRYAIVHVVEHVLIVVCVLARIVA